jgi:hypothetical protein
MQKPFAIAPWVAEGVRTERVERIDPRDYGAVGVSLRQLFLWNLHSMFVGMY